MKRTMVSILALLLICLTVLGGCKVSDEPEKETSSDSTITVIWDSSAFLYGFDNIDEAITAAKKSLDDGSSSASASQTQALINNTMLMRDWAKGKGYDIVCNAWGWSDALTSKLNAAFLAKDGPDLIIGETQMPKFAADGNLVPFPDDLASYIRENCSPVAYEGMEINGKIYGVCLAPSISILEWNKDILAQTTSYGKGTSVYENGPKDWAEWESVMKEIDALNSKQIYAGGVYCASNYGGYLRVGALLNGAGGGFAGSSGEPDINTPANQSAIEFIRTMYTHTVAGVLNTAQDSDYFSAFNRGNIAYKIDGVWAIQEAEALNFDCGFSLIPGEKEGTASNMLLGAGYLAVPTYSDKQDLIFEMIRRMLDSDIQQNIADGGLRSPILTSVIKSETYSESHPILYKFANYALDGSVKGLPAFTGNLSDLWAAVGTAVNSAITSSKPVDSILSDAQSSMMTAYSSK